MGTYNFDGADDRIDLSTGTSGATDLATYTLIAWVWPDSTMSINDNRIFNKAGGINVGAMQMNASGTVTQVRVRQILSTGTGIRVTATGFLTANSWNCIAMTWEQNAFHAGAPRAWRYPGTGTTFTEPTYTSTTNGGGGTTNTVSTEVLQYGNTTTSDRGWKGNLGPAALYDRVLTGEEMYQFREGAPPLSGLVRLWEMDTGTIRDIVVGMNPAVYGARYDDTRDEGRTYSLTPPGGKMKVYLSNAWTEKPAKVFLNGQWVEKPVKYHNGTSWVVS